MILLVLIETTILTRIWRWVCSYPSRRSNIFAYITLGALLTLRPSSENKREIYFIITCLILFTFRSHRSTVFNILNRMCRQILENCGSASKKLKVEVNVLITTRKELSLSKYILHETKNSQSGVNLEYCDFIKAILPCSTST